MAAVGHSVAAAAVGALGRGGAMGAARRGITKLSYK